MTIKDFNIDEALNGASIGFIKLTNVDQYIIDFKISNTGKAVSEYVGIGQDDNKKYYFNSSGLCADGDSSHTLYRLEEDINTNERGTVASRGDSEGGIEEISIDNMQPREQFALAAMQIILNKLDIPILGIDNFKIIRVCDLAFKIAQQMMSTAAKYRADLEDNPGEGDEQDIEVDINTITNASDKLLYNINNNLSEMSKYIKVVSDNSTTNKDNIETIKDNSTSSVTALNTIATNLSNNNSQQELLERIADSNDSILSSIPSEPISVNVINTPSVTISGQPISVTLPSEEV